MKTYLTQWDGVTLRGKQDPKKDFPNLYHTIAKYDGGKFKGMVYEKVADTFVPVMPFSHENEAEGLSTAYNMARGYIQQRDKDIENGVVPGKTHDGKEVEAFKVVSWVENGIHYAEVYRPASKEKIPIGWERGVTKEEAIHYALYTAFSRLRCRNDPYISKYKPYTDEELPLLKEQVVIKKYQTVLPF